MTNSKRRSHAILYQCHFNKVVNGHHVGYPAPKSCSVQKQNAGMINAPLNGGGANEKATIHRRADYLCPEAGSRLSWVRPRRVSAASWISPTPLFTHGERNTMEFPLLNSDRCDS